MAGSQSPCEVEAFLGAELPKVSPKCVLHFLPIECVSTRFLGNRTSNKKTLWFPTTMTIVYIINIIPLFLGGRVKGVGRRET